MFVSDWMTKKVFTIGPDDSVSDAVMLMKEKGIKHLPVLKGDRLKGIISDRDIKEFSPSKATTLDVYELHYLLAVTKVKGMMKEKVVSVGPETPVEEAAVLMHDLGIGCLPVVSQGRLAGIISDKDIYRALIDITGVRRGGLRVFVTVEDRPGSIREVADIVRRHDFHLASVLSSYEGAQPGCRDVVIRAVGEGDFRRLKAELEKTYAGAKIKKG